MLGQVFLDEPGTDVHVELHERRVADAAEAVNLAGLDHQDVAGAGLELLAVHRPQPAPFPDELHFIVRMTMRSRTPAGKRAEEEDRHVHVAVVGADELMRAAHERQILLAHSVHRADASGFKRSDSDTRTKRRRRTVPGRGTWRRAATALRLRGAWSTPFRWRQRQPAAPIP